MNIELKQAAQMALDALTEMIVAGKSNTWAAQQAVHYLRAALAPQPATPEPVEDSIRNAEDELNCAEEVLDAITCEFSDGEFPVTDFNCIGDYITAVVDVFKERLAAQQPTTPEPIGQVFYAADGGDDETGAGYHMKPYVHWFDKALTADTKLCTHQAPSLPNAVTPPTEDGTEYDYSSGHAAKQDAAALNWIERQYLEELGMGLVIDAPNDGKYYVCGDSGTTHYGKTLREALASAIAEGV